MFKSTKVQMLSMLAIGALLGFLAGTGKLDATRQANATSPTTQEIFLARPNTSEASCSEGQSKAQLLAAADPHLKPAGAQAQIVRRAPNWAPNLDSLLSTPEAGGLRLRT